MQKIISLFKRDYEGTRLVLNELAEGAEWVVAGEGIATEKIDGTAALWRDGKLYKRYDAKKGKTPPANFEPAQEPDPITGHWPGWLPVSDTAPEDKWLRACLANSKDLINGATYEAIGPKIQGNKYNLLEHILRKHGDVILQGVPRDFDGLKQYLDEHPQYEGIVWHHQDGRQVKLKRRDFGFGW